MDSYVLRSSVRLCILQLGCMRRYGLNLPDHSTTGPRHFTHWLSPAIAKANHKIGFNDIVVKELRVKRTWPPDRLDGGMSRLGCAEIGGALMKSIE